MLINEVESFIKHMRLSFRIVNPWKKEVGESYEYQRGWNDCRKSLQRNEAELLRFFKGLVPKEKQ